MYLENIIRGGMGVALGYKNLPQLTEEKFINYNGERVFRSGDLVKWDKDGNIIVYGRLDSQIKLRGLRIELGEIERLIDTQPDIGKSVVVVRTINGQEHLCAYFTSEAMIDISALRNELGKKLPHYMTPTAYLRMDKLPVTANGKTDTKNLPEPIVIDTQEYVAPTNETEKFFCNTFEKILHIEKVGINDNFFMIGGTSLLATSIIVEAEIKGFKLNYGDVFKLTTPKKLAAAFTESRKNDTYSKYDRIFADFDYSAINKVLDNNNLSSFPSGEQRDIGNILLTGATGFMGIHLLKQYLEEEKGIAYCLVRKGRYKDAALRLENVFFYYFSEKYSDLFPDRVVVINGDVTEENSFHELEHEPVDTVFNCAANVKHFSNGTDIEDVNVGGTVNCIKFCKKTGARLIHFSTVSVGGALKAEPENDGKLLDEKTLYFGQSIENQYAASKLLAEREVLSAAAQGYDAKVIRVGTLSPRESDGEFQINFFTNSLMGRLRSYMMLGCFPYQNINQPLRMGPVDTSAKAFLKLAKTPKECCMFNATNSYVIPYFQVINIMKKSGIKINYVELDEFVKVLKEAEKDPVKASILQSMIAYINKNDDIPKRMVVYDCEYTTQVLARMGFFWTPMSDEYVEKFIRSLSELGFFDTEILIR